MLTPYGVGCAYVCMGTWSSLQGVSVIHVSLFFRLSGCHLRARYIICVITMMFNLKMFYEKIDFIYCSSLDACWMQRA